MEIPNKVRIGSADYEVKLTKENLVCDGRECVGTIDYGFHIINIQEGIQDKQAPEITFLHELLHGIVRERNLEIENEELVVEEISRGLHQVIRDNTEMFIEKCVVSYDPYIVKTKNEISINEIAEEVARKLSDSLKLAKR